MKLYVIPVQESCNAKCWFCITKHKKETGFGDLLNINSLYKLVGIRPEKIEITGGGEPLLHRDIDKIVEWAADVAPSQIYTNGQLLMRLSEGSLKKLCWLCISRSHYDDEINYQIMGVRYDTQMIRSMAKFVPIKLSLVLTRSGIGDGAKLLEYVRWSKKKIGARAVVVRQMFDIDYFKGVAKEFVETSSLYSKLRKDYALVGEINDNPLLEIDGVRVEFEYRDCACQMNNLVLRPNGRIYTGWGEEEYVCS